MSKLSKKHILFVVLSGVLLGLVTAFLLVLYFDPSLILLEEEIVVPEDLTAAPSPFVEEEEVVLIEVKDGRDIVGTVMLPIEKVLFQYVEITESCGIHYEGECVNVRSGPGTDYDVVGRVRNSMVLKVSGQVIRDNQVWYKIVFDEWLRYPERVTDDWYISADYVRVLFDEGNKEAEDDMTSTTTKKIIVDRSDQRLYAYEGEDLFLETDISTGLALTPTPRGEFTIFKKTPSRYMQGPLPYLASDKYYDLPGVPWNLYFTKQGAVIHGAYWHSSFGTPYSHGCVNLAPDNAENLYNWADLGTKVIVRD